MPLNQSCFESLFNIEAVAPCSLVDVLLQRYGAVVMDDQNDDGSIGYTVLHNSSCQHAAPTFINLMNGAILRLATGDKNMTLRTRNHPLPMTRSQRLQRHVSFSFLGNYRSFVIF